MSTPTTGTTTTDAVIYTRMDSPVGELVIAGVRQASAPGGVALCSVKMEKWKGDVRVACFAVDRAGRVTRGAAAVA